MMMWLQTTSVRHLTITAGALCGSEPAMIWKRKGGAHFTFWPPNGHASADFDLPICSRCARILDRLKAEAV